MYPLAFAEKLEAEKLERIATMTDTPVTLGLTLITAIEIRISHYPAKEEAAAAATDEVPRRTRGSFLFQLRVSRSGGALHTTPSAARKKNHESTTRLRTRTHGTPCPKHPTAFILQLTLPSR